VATSRRTITHEGGSEGDGTLNQLLCELDGLDEKGVTVVTIGTTNRRSMLDTALTRPVRGGEVCCEHERAVPRRSHRIELDDPARCSLRAIRSRTR